MFEWFKKGIKIMRPVKIYYAHPMSLYNTEQEKIDLSIIKYVWSEAEIYNPFFVSDGIIVVVKPKK